MGCLWTEGKFAWKLLLKTQIVQYALLILKQFFHEEKENIWHISKKKGILDD